jgi:curved DNA-binding protein CbpA
MQTLYDLLGALPRDDAEELRAAFRRAVKGAHPDLNPGDPDAGEKFREILRANEILSDEEQRAAYDHLLDLAHQEHRQQAAAKTGYKFSTVITALVVVAAGGVGGYVTHQNMPQISDRLKHIAAIATASPADFAGLSPAPVGARLQPPVSSDPRAEASEAKEGADASAQIASIEPPFAEQPEKSGAASVPANVIAPVAPPAQTVGEAAPQAAAGPPLEIAPGDAKVFRERGIFAYRSGDLHGAVAEFDRAIQLDPKFSAAYVDRGIALYRMQKFERAFADIAHAKRIERTRRGKAAQSDARKKAAALGLPPFFQRRTAKLD